MLDQITDVLKAEEFANNIHENLIKYLESIQKDAHEVLGIDKTLAEFKDRKNHTDIQDLVIDEEL